MRRTSYPLPHRYRVDPLAFIGAFIAAPILPALVLSPFLLATNGILVLGAIPLMALYLGGIPYLVFGIPALLYLLPRFGPDMAKVTGTAVSIAVAMTVFGTLGVSLASGSDVAVLLIFGLFAVIFALLWSALFVVLFGKFERSAYRARNGR